MRSAEDIRKLRSSRGFFTRGSIVDAFCKEGIRMTAETYSNKEHGRTPFSAREVKALVNLLGISAQEGFDFFV